MKKKMYFLLLLAFVGLCANMNAQNLNLTWAKSMGNLGGDNGRAMALDGAGNIYTTGLFNGVVDFDPGVGVSNLTSAGATDIFVLKLDANGNFLWAKSMGGTGAEIGAGIAIDASGSVYTTGSFEGTVDFDPSILGTSNLTSNGLIDAFVSKLDINGNFVWAFIFGGSTDNDRGTGIKIDATGMLYITGSFTGNTDFNPSNTVTTFLTNAGSSDIFVLKLNTNLSLSNSLVWVKNIGGVNADVASAITVDNSGNVYTTGYFQDTADFNPNAGVNNLVSSGLADIFVCKLDVNGNLVWATKMGGIGNDVGFTITVDASGNVYSGGYFSDTVDFDPGVGVTNLVSAGLIDMYVSKLNASANFLWAKSTGGINNDICWSLAIDAANNVYSTGYFNDTADFDPNAGVNNLTSTGLNDIFITKLNTNGDFIWANSCGSAFNDNSFAIIVSITGNIYTTGFFNGIVDFDFGVGTSNLTTAGSSDIFITKYFECPTVIISPASLSNGVAGTIYNQNLTQTGLTGALVWSISGGVLPDGLNLSNGVISGTPTTAGNGTFTVRATDANTCIGVMTYTFTISSAVPPVVPPNPATALDNSLSNLIKVSPNPSNGDFQVDFSGLNVAKSLVRVYDTQGKQVLSSENNANLTTISLKNMPNGIYLLEIETSKGRILKRLAKND